MANTLPIFSAAPAISGSSILNSGTIAGPSANTAQDGSGANVYPIFQAGTNGSWITEITFKAIGSPAATVARVFFCNSTSGTFTPNSTNSASNSQLVRDIGLPAVTLSQTAASPDFTMQVGKGIPASTWLFVTFGTSTGSTGTGFDVTVWGGYY